MYAQLGAFTITHREQISIEDIGDGAHVWRFRIPHQAKADILEELSILHINRLALFPELQSVAEIAKEIIK
jgi:hypothetical protein